MTTAQRKSLQVIVACTQRLGIGLQGTIPWKLPADMKYFKRLTTKTSDAAKRNAVIMGRKTFESIPPKFRPLPQRLNIVLTSQVERKRAEYGAHEDVKVVGSFNEAVEFVRTCDSIENVFVIGGASVYASAMESAYCERLYVTRVYGAKAECDTYFPEIDPTVYEVASTSEPHTHEYMKYEFIEFTRRRHAATAAAGDDGGVAESKHPTTTTATEHEEMQYLNMIRDIIDNGVQRGDRTGTGTLSKFGRQMRFSLRDNVFPLLTTKRVFWRGVAEELLWFVAGSTNAKLLHDKEIRIWDGNASREFLDARGLRDREEWDLGPVYGFQWRHFGAAYETMHTDYTGKGMDQLRACIETIKTNPEDRRIILSAWNPADLHQMALPPCHLMAQFYVANGELSCLMYQRSCDMGLGVPFNIASYALLTRMIAQVCGLKPGEFVHTLGDAHVYMNHVEPLREQLQRTPTAFPTLEINPDITDIDGFTYKDFKLKGYKPHGRIAMKMAVSAFVDCDMKLSALSTAFQPSSFAYMQDDNATSTDESPHIMRVLEQVEYMMSDANLWNDKFLSGKIHEDPDGYIDVALLPQFARVAAVTRDPDDVVKSVRSSGKLALSMDCKRLKRLKPLPPRNVKAENKRSVYVSHLPAADSSIKYIKSVFEHFGSIQNVQMCVDANPTSAFIEFSSKAAVRNVMSARGTPPLDALTIVPKAKYKKPSAMQRRGRSMQAKNWRFRGAANNNTQDDDDDDGDGSGADDNDSIPVMSEAEKKARRAKLYEFETREPSGGKAPKLQLVSKKTIVVTRMAKGPDGTRGFKSRQTTDESTT